MSKVVYVKGLHLKPFVRENMFTILIRVLSKGYESGAGLPGSFLKRLEL